MFVNQNFIIHDRIKLYLEMKKQILIFIIASFFMNPLSAQNFRMTLWDGIIPNSKESNETEIADTSDIIKISKVQIPDISVFLPSKRNASGEAVVICPGGGYRILAYDWEGSDIAKFWNSKGVAAIVLKYRLPSASSQIEPHKTPLIDAQRAMRLVRLHAKEWNISPDKIGIMGFSAGGHLASTLSTHFDPGNPESSDKVEQQSCRPDFSILVYPVISLNKYTHSGSKNALIGKNATKELQEYYSNELQVTQNTPPAILIHSSDDKAVPVKNSLLYYEALIKHNVKAEMHIYPYGGHGYSLAYGKGHLSTWIERCNDWLKSLN